MSKSSLIFLYENENSRKIAKALFELLKYVFLFAKGDRKWSLLHLCDFTLTVAGTVTIDVVLVKYVYKQFT